MKPVCVIMIGLPATGKSTIRESLIVDQGNTFIYSTDDIVECMSAKEGLTYDEGFSKFISAADKQARQSLIYAIEAKMDVIWDQTNLRKKKRIKSVTRMKQAGYNVSYVSIQKPLEKDIGEWVKRLNGRNGKTIPNNIMVNMIETYEEPTLDEGVSGIEIYNMYGELIDG